MDIIADADSIIAQAYLDDPHHNLSIDLAKKIKEKGATVIFPATAVAEAVTAIQRKFSNPDLADVTLKTFTDPTLIVENIDREIIEKASKFFNSKSSKHNTVFDCIVAAIAMKHRAEAIFSFDSWYKKQGFKLVSELIF